MTPASIEIAIPEGVSARLALEWAVERLIRMIDALDAAEDLERAECVAPRDCRLTVSPSPADIHTWAVGEDVTDGI